MINEQVVVMKQLTRVIKIFMASNGAIRPHFILTGPSGSGKSHIIQRLAEELQTGYLEINAAQLTKEGTSGNSLSKALGGLRNLSGKPTICFVDEFDKLFITGNSNSNTAHEVTHGVQNEFLRVLESNTASVFGDYGKFDSISMENVLFVFAGAFNGEEDIDIDRLRELGLKTEFLGRVGLAFSLQKLSLESMQYALQTSTLLANYLQLFPEVDRETVINEVMNVIKQEYSKNTLGIRLINTLLNQYFINDGKLREKEVKKISFQTSLSFDSKAA